MQSHPHEFTTRTPPTSTPQSPTATSQDGFPQQEQGGLFAGHADLQPDDRVQHSADSSDRASSPTSPTTVGPAIAEQLGRLRLRDHVDRPAKPKFYQISDYENASTPSPPRKQSEGPGFKVVRRKDHATPPALLLQDFPNGELMPY